MKGDVHIMKHGRTLCGIPWVSIGDASARWVSFQDKDARRHATCDLCIIDHVASGLAEKRTVARSGST